MDDLNKMLPNNDNSTQLNAHSIINNARQKKCRTQNIKKLLKTQYKVHITIRCTHKSTQYRLSSKKYRLLITQYCKLSSTQYRLSSTQ